MPTTRPTLTLTAFGAALLDTAECEHGRPMDAPCGPCAVAGHEPVDVERTDDTRHLADCRGCALCQPDGHAYASLIDAPLTAGELAELADRHDVADTVARVAADALAELLADERAPANDRDCADDVACPCGNDVMAEGFHPAGPAGPVTPAADGPWDGRTIACLACGRLIDTAPELAQANADTWRPWSFPVVGCLTPDALAVPLPD